MRFEQAGLEDVPRIVALVESAYRGDASRAGWTTEADLIGGRRTDEELVRGLVEGAQSRIILGLDDDGELLGCVHLDVKDGAAYVGMLSVSPTLQSKGAGGALLTEAERQAKAELGLDRARMAVIAQRPELMAWYERRGYRPTGERWTFPSGGGRQGLPKRDDLYLVVLERRL